MNRSQKRKLKRKLANQKREVQINITNRNPPVTPVVSQTRFPRITLQQRIRMLLQKDDVRFEVADTETMRLGVFYKGNESLDAHKEVLVYSDWCCSVKNILAISKKRRLLSCYLLQTEYDGEGWAIDGTNSFRIGPKINHSKKKANLAMKKIMIESKLVVYFVTTRVVARDEQLFYDYLQNDKPTDSELKAYPWLAN